MVSLSQFINFSKEEFLTIIFLICTWQNQRKERNQRLILLNRNMQKVKNLSVEVKNRQPRFRHNMNENTIRPKSKVRNRPIESNYAKVTLKRHLNNTNEAHRGKLFSNAR